MRITVTGGAGFIGRHLVTELDGLGHDVTILDSFEPQVHGSTRPHIATGAKLYEGSVCVDYHVDRALSNADAVIHLAAQVGVGQSMYDIRRYVYDNCYGTAVVLEHVKKYRDNIQKLIVASSMSIYGEGFPYRGIAEQDHLSPTSIYAVTKRDQEEACLAFGRAYDVSTHALRFFNVYGPGQSLNNPYTGVMAIFASRLLNNEAPLIFDDGLQTRDFVHVKDIVQGIVKALKSDSTGSLNIGTGKPVTILDLAVKLSRRLGKDIAPVVTHELRAGDIRHCYADITNARVSLGYQPEVALDDGIDKLVSWLKTQSPEDNMDKAYKELLHNDLVG